MASVRQHGNHKPCTVSACRQLEMRVSMLAAAPRIRLVHSDSCQSSREADWKMTQKSTMSPVWEIRRISVVGPSLLAFDPTEPVPTTNGFLLFCSPIVAVFCSSCLAAYIRPSRLVQLTLLPLDSCACFAIFRLGRAASNRHACRQQRWQGPGHFLEFTYEHSSEPRLLRCTRVSCTCHCGASN